MSEASRWLTTFFLNAIWQITAITLFALLCDRLLQRMPSRYMHRVWVLALICCLLVPLTTVLIQSRSGAAMEDAKSTEPVANRTTTYSSSPGLAISLRSMSHSVYVPPILSGALMWTLAMLLLYRATRLGLIVYSTYRIRQSAYEQEVPLCLSRLAEQCRRAFSLPITPLLCSAHVSTPATVGLLQSVVLLPENFLASDFSEHDLASALSHEFAHIRRRDFVLNLLYEVVYVAVYFHPFATFIKSQIDRTRELACDEMAAHMLPSGTCYASSLLHLAQSMSSGPARSSYALGLFDTNTLEERIVNILKGNDGGRKWVRAFKLAAVCLVGTVALGISVFSLKLAAQSATDLKHFAGTWECKYKGRTFFTLKMAVKDGTLGGTAIHSTRVSWVDGEIIPDSNETTSDKIFETHASGEELLIKIADGPNDSDPISLRFTLTGKDEAEAKLVVEKQPDAPTQTKPWHFQRVSNP